MRTLLAALLAHPPDRPAIRRGAVLTSYGSLAQTIALAAGALVTDFAVVSGARVAMLLEPGEDFVAVLFAIWRARAVAVVLSPLYPPRERAQLIADARATVIVASPGLAAVARESAGDAISLYIFRPSSAPRTASAIDPLPLPALDDLALQMYTSGTTGRPKGVLLTHRQLDAQLGALAFAWAMSPEDSLLHVLPLHHIHGLSIALLNVVRVGGVVEMLPAFDAPAVLLAFARCSVFMGVPTMYARLLDALDALDDDARTLVTCSISAMRLCTSGSAALPVSLGERWAAYAGAYPLERFGMTEVGVAFSNPLRGKRIPGSVGKALPGVRMRVVSEDGSSAREGELLIAGPTVFEGYFERPVETAEAFQTLINEGGEGDEGDNDGAHDEVLWFKTGDTVRLDADDRVQILGRTSVDILKSAGYKLSAIEIEEALRRHPRVRDAAVVGLPSETYGQVVAAAVMLKSGAALSVTELMTFMSNELASYKLPRIVRLVDDVPRNVLGKVLKRELAVLLAREPGADDSLA